MTLNDPEWLSKIFTMQNVARPLCDSWASCSVHLSDETLIIHVILIRKRKSKSATRPRLFAFPQIVKKTGVQEIYFPEMSHCRTVCRSGISEPCRTFDWQTTVAMMNCLERDASSRDWQALCDVMAPNTCLGVLHWKRGCFRHSDQNIKKHVRQI